MAHTIDSRDSLRQTWLEPEVAELDLPQTATLQGRGGDGGVVFPDCTLS